MSDICGKCIYFQSYNTNSHGQNRCSHRGNWVSSSEWGCGYFSDGNVRSAQRDICGKCRYYDGRDIDSDGRGYCSARGRVYASDDGCGDGSW